MDRNLDPCLYFWPFPERLREVELKTALRTLGLISLGLYSHYWVLLNVSGFQSPGSALACMLITRSLLAHPYLHVNIFQVRPPRPWALGGHGDHSPGCLAAGWTQVVGRERPPEKPPFPHPSPPPSVGHHRVFVPGKVLAPLQRWLPITHGSETC